MSFIDLHRGWIKKAALEVIAVADDSGQSLVTVIAEMERYIIEETKVGDAGDGRSVAKGRRGYTLVGGRLVEVGPSAGRKSTVVRCSNARPRSARAPK